MARTGNQYTIETLIRRIIRQEMRSIFTGDQENTSRDGLLNFSETPTGGTSPRRRRRGSQGRVAAIKGRVTKPTDRRLKANREL